MKVFLVLLSMFFTSEVFSNEKIVLTSQNSVSLRDVVYTQSVASVMEKLQELEKNDEPEIYLFLDTPGGSVFAGVDLITFLKGYSKPIHTITSFSASMGFQIVQSNPGKRYILENAALMSHPMSGSVYGEFGEGFSVSNYLKYLESIQKNLDMDVVRRNPNYTLEEYIRLYDNELWLNGQNSVEKGFADSIVGIVCGDDLDGLNEQQERFTLFREDVMLIIETTWQTHKCYLENGIKRFKIDIIIPEIVNGKINQPRFTIYSSGYSFDTDGKLDLNNNKVLELNNFPEVKQVVEKTINRFTKTRLEQLELIKQGKL